jgi:hypothetical protein
MNLLNVYYKYMENPILGLQGLLDRCSFRQACLGYLMAAVGWVVFFNVGDGISFPMLILKLVVVFVAELTIGFVLSAFAGLFLDLRHTRVSSAELFVMVGSAGFIKGLLIIGAIISAMFPHSDLYLLAPLFLLLVWILQLGYLTRGLVRMEDISVARALSAWLFGIVPVCVLFGLALLFFAWGILLLI